MRRWFERASWVVMSVLLGACAEHDAATPSRDGAVAEADAGLDVAADAEIDSDDAGRCPGSAVIAEGHTPGGGLDSIGTVILEPTWGWTGTSAPPAELTFSFEDEVGVRVLWVFFTGLADITPGVVLSGRMEDTRLEGEVGTNVELEVASFEVEPSSDGARGRLSGSLRALDEEWVVSIALDASWCAASWYL